MPILPFNFSSRGIGPIRTAEDAAGFGLPVLASIIEFEPAPGRRLPAEVYTEALDAYRRLAEVVRTPDFNVRGRAIVVAGASSGSGCTTTARNLASLLAQNGRKALVVDCNPRRVARRRPGDGTTSTGFAGLLTNQLMRPSSTLQDTSEPSVKLVPAGSTAGSRETLLRSTRLPLVISSLREVTDYVILDAGSLPEDLGLLTRLADAALLLFRSGRTTRKDALAAASQLLDASPEVYGVVLNRAPVATPTGAVDVEQPLEDAAEEDDFAETVPMAKARADQPDELSVQELLMELEAVMTAMRAVGRPSEDPRVREEEATAAAKH